MAAKQITINISDEDQTKLNKINLTRGYSEKTLIELVVKRGIYALNQRTEYNAKKNADLREFREWKATQK